MKIKELLTDESKWTQGSFARDKDGNKVGLATPEAVCWCISGAVMRCYDPFKAGAIEEMILIHANVHRSIKVSIMGWNDHPSRTFEDIKSLVNYLDI
jgi:hypothetical protein